MASYAIEEIKSKETWNALVKSSSVHVLQSYEWGKAKANFNWQPRRLAIKHNNVIIALASALVYRIPIINRVILYVPRGPIFLGADNKEQIEIVLSSLKHFAKQQRAIFLKISPDIPFKNRLIRDTLRKQGFVYSQRQIQHQCTVRVNIRNSKDTLFKNLEYRTRYAIRKAEKKGVSVETSNEVESLMPFYHILQKTSEQRGFRIYPYSFYCRLTELGIGRVFLAKFNQNFISAAFVLTYSNKCWYLSGGLLREYQSGSPNQMLQWEIIKWAKANRYINYDLQGVPCGAEKEKSGYGIYLFKKGFGGEFVKLIGEYDYILSPILYRMWLYFMKHRGRIEK